MAIEIRELVLRAVVEPRRAPAVLAAPAPPDPVHPAAHPAPDLDALVARCVREVLRELRSSRGR